MRASWAWISSCYGESSGLGFEGFAVAKLAAEERRVADFAAAAAICERVVSTGAAGVRLRGRNDEGRRRRVLKVRCLCSVASVSGIRHGSLSYQKSLKMQGTRHLPGNWLREICFWREASGSAVGADRRTASALAVYVRLEFERENLSFFRGVKRHANHDHAYITAWATTENIIVSY